MRIALVTCERPVVRDRDIDFLVPALKRRGVEAEAVVWTDSKADWSSYSLAMLSSTWDYHERTDEFRAWLERAQAATRLRNERELVTWNLDKRYLRELEAAGVPVVPTIWAEPAAAGAAAREIGERGWPEVVIKPVVDLGATQLVRIAAEHAEQMISRYAGAVLVQPFLGSLLGDGELSLVYAGGVLLHALRKVPASGDFRVQPEYGGTESLLDPPGEATEVAGRALAVAPGRPLYARVDLVRRDDGRLAVIELELIEPALFLELQPRSAETLARILQAAAS